MRLPSHQPLILNLRIAKSRAKRCKQWGREPGELVVSSAECDTNDDDEDSLRIKSIAESVISAQTAGEETVLVQVIMNPTDEEIWMVEGTVLG